MTVAMNTAAIKSVIGGQNTARVKAEKDYNEILFNPARSSDQDKADLATAMEILGKTPDQALADQAAVVKSHELAAAAAGHDEAAAAIETANADFNKFLRVERPAIEAELERREREHRNNISAARARETEILRKLLDLRRHRLAHPHLANTHLAKDPADAPAEIYINGTHYNPHHGVDPRSGI